MVKAGGDEQTVQEGVDAHADHVHLGDGGADGDQHAKDDGPGEEQNGRSDDGDHAGDNSHAPLAREEGQEVRQLGVLEFVVAQGADDTGQDADEGVGDLGVGHRPGLIGHQGGGVITGRAYQGGHHEPGNQTGQTAGAVIVLGKTNAHTDGEQDGHVVDQSGAGLDKEKANGIGDAGSGVPQLGGPFRTHHVGGTQSIADAHQDTTDGQNGHGKHQGFAELLQSFHHNNFLLTFSLLISLKQNSNTPPAHGGSERQKGRRSLSYFSSSMTRSPLVTGPVWVLTLVNSSLLHTTTGVVTS